MTSINKNDNSGRHKNIETILFPTPGAGPENQHMTSITKNDKYSIEKDVKSILFPTYPPAFHPHSFVVPGRKSNTGPLSPRTTTPAVTKYAKKKDVKSILFPTYPPAFHSYSFVAQDRRTNT
ncbi:hypothetical protein TNCV_456471 [Trichonephila clavipes]|uniref:Uncharacterized protein n=1 Tax=Trichonephila clavipes TaxID=2585209 RepID=A0A8X6V3D6_TRICX|nr:hypothetical protein TNCV_456471 [Trichonephila clavipes]